MSLRVAFMGTPDFAVPSLSEILAAGHEVARVYTQPARKSGRGQKVTKSAVHQFADVMGLEVATPESFRKKSVIDELEALNLDVACVVAYGQILPSRALQAPKYGCLNLHGSALPRWRGAAPIQRAIMAGDKTTAAQIMQMAKGLDTGDIVMSASEIIRDTDTASSLHDRLSHIGAQLWAPTLAALERAGLQASPQIGEPTYAAKIDKAEARLDWSRPAAQLDCHIRGLSPYPGAWCEIAGKRVKVLRAKPVDGSGQPGEIITGLTVACGAQALELVRVQPAGKGAMEMADFLRGHDVPAGTILS